MIHATLIGLAVVVLLSTPIGWCMIAVGLVAAFLFGLFSVAGADAVIILLGGAGIIFAAVLADRLIARWRKA